MGLSSEPIGMIEMLAGLTNWGREWSWGRKIMNLLAVEYTALVVAYMDSGLREKYVPITCEASTERF